ncbi:MAG TPA: putative LPS assembly protein LptD [bacterium]|nr:putative LPS assembly protein LptD [bacterium]HPR86667.1 putative LPS assembly protein LptD [bacterium]
MIRTRSCHASIRSALLYALLLCVPQQQPLAQVPHPGDRAGQRAGSGAAVDSLAAARTQPKPSSGVDTTIVYQARDIDNDVRARKSYFTGDAQVHYKNMMLKAGRITIDWDAQTLTAEGIPDTVWVKSRTGNDSTRQPGFRGLPVLVENGSEMTGEKMFYNYKTERGRVLRGRTTFEDGRYLGEQIKLVGNKTFNVSNSIYTTCDLDSNPHFHFKARRLKMIVNERVIAKPIVLYLGHIPVAALPFAFFPTKTGRHSGLIIPRYGESTQEGRHLRGLGYYWAPNDYFDAQATVDYFEKSGWLMEMGTNYAVRYLLNGSIEGSFTRKNFTTGNKSRRWDLTIRHSQEFSPTSRFSASGYFISDNSYYKDLSTSIYTRLTRELRSNATWSKYWAEQKLSLSVNFSQVHDLQDDLTQTTLPQLSLRKSQTQIFKPGKAKPGAGSRRANKWYHNLYLSYGANYSNSRREYLAITSSDTSKKVDINRSLNNSLDLSLNSPNKYFGFIAVNHALSVEQDWYDRIHTFALNPETGVIVDTEESQLAARHTFNYSASANTKIYGIVAPGIGDIQAIRHVITPSLSFSYRPDFSDRSWGYYTYLKDASGKTVKRDRFGGSTGSGGTQMVSMSVRNLFQMKRGSGEKTKKIDLFNMDFSTSYNFRAEQYRLSDLRSSWQANPARNFSLSAGTTHSFYAWDKATARRVNRYLFEQGGWRQGDWARLTSFNLNFSLRFEGKGEKKQKSSGLADSTGAAGDSLKWDDNLTVEEENMLRRGRRFQDDRAFSQQSIPWRLNTTFNFSLDKSNPERPMKRYYLDISGAELSLTRNLRIGYSAHLDLEKGTVAYHRMTFYRDLHCWEASVDWVPSGPGKRVYFRINVKAPSLSDIKLERFGGAGSVLGY